MGAWNKLQLLNITQNRKMNCAVLLMAVIAAAIAASNAAPMAAPPNCDPTAEVKEKIDAAVRNIIGKKADKFMEALEKDEDATFEDAVKAAGVDPQETGKVLKVVHQIYSQGWKCPPKMVPPPNCDPTAEVIEKIEAAVRNLIGDKADKFMDAMKKDEDASFEDAVKAAGVEPQETGKVLKVLHHIYSQGWECPKTQKEVHPKCDVPAEIKEKIETTVRHLVGDKADKFMETLENDEDSSLQDAVKAAGMDPKETGKVLGAVQQILSKGWECPKKEVHPECDAPAEVKEKI